MSSSDHFHVVLRSKHSSLEQPLWKVNARSNSLRAAQEESKAEEFVFTKVFEESTSHLELYEQAIAPGVSSLLNGAHTNLAVIAYGPSCGGKSHSVFGTSGQTRVREEARGVIYRCGEQLLRELGHKQATYSVSVSFLHVFEDGRVADLFDTKNRNMEVVLDQSTMQCTVPVVTQQKVNSLQEVLRLVEKGYLIRNATGCVREPAKRTGFSSAMKPLPLQQYRPHCSHAVFTFAVQFQPVGAEDVQAVSVTVVDLAGRAVDEFLSSSSCSDVGIDTMHRIMTSLSSEGPTAASPLFGKSSLTKLLRHCFGGNCDTVLLATIPLSNPLTGNCLQFLSQSLNIKNFSKRTVLPLSHSELTNSSSDNSVHSSAGDQSTQRITKRASDGTERIKLTGRKPPLPLQRDTPPVVKQSPIKLISKQQPAPPSPLFTSKRALTAVDADQLSNDSLSLSSDSDSDINITTPATPVSGPPPPPLRGIPHFNPHSPLSSQLTSKPLIPSITARPPSASKKPATPPKSTPSESSLSTRDTPPQSPSEAAVMRGHASSHPSNPKLDRVKDESSRELELAHTPYPPPVTVVPQPPVIAQLPPLTRATHEQPSTSPLPTKPHDQLPSPHLHNTSATPPPPPLPDTLPDTLPDASPSPLVTSTATTLQNVSLTLRDTPSPATTVAAVVQSAAVPDERESELRRSGGSLGDVSNTSSSVSISSDSEGELREEARDLFNPSDNAQRRVLSATRQGYSQRVILPSLIPDSHTHVQFPRQLAPLEHPPSYRESDQQPCQLPMYTSSTPHTASTSRESEGNFPERGMASHISGEEIHVAAMEGVKASEMKRLAIQYGIDYKDVGGRTPLMYAVLGNQPKMCETLVKLKASLNVKDSSGLTPLFWASFLAKAEVIRVLLKSGADPHSTDSGGRTVFHWAMRTPNFHCLKWLCKYVNLPSLINKQDSEGLTALHWAVMADLDVHIRHLLTTTDADVSIKDKQCRPPLNYAVLNFSPACIRAILEVREDAVNLTDNKGRTALHYACAEGSADCVRTLLSFRSCDLHCTDNNGTTPLHWAAAANKPDIIQLLVRRGADRAQKDNSDMTPLDHAHQRNHKECIKVLQTYGLKRASSALSVASHVSLPTHGGAPPTFDEDGHVIMRHPDQTFSMTVLPAGDRLPADGEAGGDENSLCGRRNDDQTSTVSHGLRPGPQTSRRRWSVLLCCGSGRRSNVVTPL